VRDHQELLELAALLPLGTLDAEDERRLEEHLRGGCAECEESLRGAAQVVDALAAEVTPLEPSPALRARILAQAEASAGVGAGGGARRGAGTGAPRARRRWLATAFALAAGVLVAVGLGLEVRDLRAALAAAQQQVARLESALAGAAQERAELARELAAAERTLGELTARETRTVALAATGPLPEASARAFLDPEGRRLLLVVYELPPPPPGQSYQLWVIVGGEPVSAGVFDVEAGVARHQASALPSIEGPVTIAVTIEPAGGVPKPTGPIVLAGS
jgi:anti-sigma-K factor RskA